MNLALRFEDLSFAYLQNLVRFINEHVDRENYAMILKRIKKFKEETINKT
jgi:heme oxygenase